MKKTKQGNDAKESTEVGCYSAAARVRKAATTKAKVWYGRWHQVSSNLGVPPMRPTLPTWWASPRPDEVDKSSNNANTNNDRHRISPKQRRFDMKEKQRGEREKKEERRKHIHSFSELVSGVCKR